MNKLHGKLHAVSPKKPSFCAVSLSILLNTIQAQNHLRTVMSSCALEIRTEKKRILLNINNLKLKNKPD